MRALATGADGQGLPKLLCKLPYPPRCVAQGELRRERSILDTGRLPGVYNQGPGNCGSGRVKPPNRSTRGTTIKTKNTPKQCEEVLQVVANLCSDRPKERKTCDLNNELAKAQLRVRHRGQQDGDTTAAA